MVRTLFGLGGNSYQMEGFFSFFLSNVATIICVRTTQEVLDNASDTVIIRVYYKEFTSVFKPTTTADF